MLTIFLKIAESIYIFHLIRVFLFRQYFNWLIILTFLNENWLSSLLWKTIFNKYNSHYFFSELHTVYLYLIFYSEMYATVTRIDHQNIVVLDFQQNEFVYHRQHTRHCLIFFILNNAATCFLHLWWLKGSTSWLFNDTV